MPLARAWNLSNGKVSALVHPATGLASLTASSSNTLIVSNDSWRLDVTLPVSNWTSSLFPGACTQYSSERQSISKLAIKWICAGPSAAAHQLPLQFSVSVLFALPPGASFVTKSLRVGTSRPYSQLDGTFVVNHVEPFGGGLVVNAASARVHSNPYGRTAAPQIATFVRGASGAPSSGGFLSIANPFGAYAARQLGSVSQFTLTASFKPAFTHRAANAAEGIDMAYEAEAGLLGLTQLTAFEYESGANTGEHAAFTAASESFQLDERHSTVKVKCVAAEFSRPLDLWRQPCLASTSGFGLTIACCVACCVACCRACYVACCVACCLASRCRLLVWTGPRIVTLAFAAASRGMKTTIRSTWRRPLGAPSGSASSR